MATGLTETIIKATKPKNKRFTLFDTGGLYIEVSPSGGKWWRFRFKDSLGKTKVISLGTHPEISLKAARVKRDELRTKIANGDFQDIQPKAPIIVKAPECRLFSDVAKEWYEFKSKTWSEYSKKIVKYILQWLGPVSDSKPVGELDVQDFLRIFRAYEKRGKFCISNKLAGTATQIMRYARLCGYIKLNPLVDVKDLLIHKKTQHFATISDPEEIGRLLCLIDSKKCINNAYTALRIMPYVFVRSNELLYSRWEEIDLDAAIWKIPAERMKMRREHIVPLARQVVTLFREHQKSSTGPYCFPSKKNSRTMERTVLNDSLHRLGVPVGTMTVHGFRSMASTLLNEKGYRPDIIELQLAHVDKNAIRRTYNHALYLDERRQMMQEWADYLDSLRDAALELQCTNTTR